MRIIKLSLLLLPLFLLFSCESSNEESSNETSTERKYFQLKVYSFDSEAQVQIVDEYLRDAFLPGVKGAGINEVGVFKRRPSETDSTLKTYVLLPFQTLDQFHKLEDRLLKDETYLDVGNDYLNAAHDRAPYARMESILMYAFSDFPGLGIPDLDSPRSERVYELRSYESPTEAYYRNKVDMFNAGGEVKLFDRLEFNAVFYGEVISGAKMPNLMYMTTFANQESRDQHWKAFVDAPEWKELIGMEKYKNNVSHIDIDFLYPTEYSDY
jgi:hypothetical protein